MEDWRRVSAENEDPLNTLLLLGTWYHQTLQCRPEILQLRARSAIKTPDPDAAGAGKQMYHELREFIEELFVRARDEGRIKPDSDVQTLTLLFLAIGALLDVIHQIGLDEDVTPRELMAMANTVLEGRFAVASERPST
jgi:hypothetical protein